MDIFTAIIVFVIIIIGVSFIDIRLSIALYISYQILVPYLQFNLGGLTLSYNLVNTILLLALLYEYMFRKKTIKLNYRQIQPFVFLYFSLLIISLFSWGMPWSNQFNNWRASFMQTCIFSFIIWNISIDDRKTLTYIKWSLAISVLIAGLYGIVLMKMEGMNPYTSMISNHFNITDSADTYEFLESRLSFSTAGKIQSTMIHPMTWTLVLCFMTVIFTSIILKSKEKILIPLLILIGFNILVSGVRTGIAALAVGFVYFLIQYRKFKILAITGLSVAVAALIIISNEDLTNIFSSFFDLSGNKSDIQGSSISMRLEQFQGAINEIKGHELVGRGYGWHDYYMTNNGDHPVLLAFESLIFIVTCNSGVLGAIIWSIFTFLLFRLNRKMLKSKLNILLADTLIIVFLAYSIGTGEYGYLQFFSAYYSFLLAYLFWDERKVRDPMIDYQSN